MPAFRVCGHDAVRIRANCATSSVSAVRGKVKAVVVGVPELATYESGNGIGRVLHSLASEWQGVVELVEARLDAPGLPILRNEPRAIDAPSGTDLILLPQMTGAQGLRDTGGIPSVAIVHDVGVVDCAADRMAGSLISRRIVRRSFRALALASRIVTVSHFTRAALLRHRPELQGRVRVVRNGVAGAFTRMNLSRDSARTRIASAIGSPLKTPLLIYVGSEHPRKNMSLLIDAFRIVRRQFPKAQLLKVGGPGRPEFRQHTLRAIVEHGLAVGTDVLFLAAPGDDSLAEAYAAADVYVSASIYEGFGMPAVEAIAMGKPVVVTNHGAFPEIVGRWAHLAAPEPRQFAHVVSTVLGSRMDQAAAELQSEQVASAYSWKCAAQEYLAVFNELLNRAPHVPVCHT